ncbi:hypothetical protein Dda_5861 [Drechslerella dactyloides]|uniref:Ketoreductase domain-containing protein n=1 Tax=Drechslerella dactyloides TaxID=74499 RepID=A0AAD6IV35_DREDA|nr:hypothetical protein Dda_5861 [Drechslerella dactyloides]
MLDLIGRSCLITGGSRGIGLAIATRFASAGANCTLVARSLEPLRDAVSTLPRADDVKQTHDVLSGDVGDPEFWKHAVGMKPEISILVNAAGQAQASPLFNTRPEDIERLIAVNLLGAIYGTKAYTRGMMKAREGANRAINHSSSITLTEELTSRRPPGCIINISSALAATGGKGSAVYAASKAGLDGFAKSMVKEVSRFNIRINNILPGYIETDMTAAMSEAARKEALSKTPLGTFGTVKEVAEAAYFLATNKFITGTNLVIDGGYSHHHFYRRVANNQYNNRTTGSSRKQISHRRSEFAETQAKPD